MFLLYLVAKTTLFYRIARNSQVCCKYWCGCKRLTLTCRCSSIRCRLMRRVGLTCFSVSVWDWSSLKCQLHQEKLQSQFACNHQTKPANHWPILKIQICLNYLAHWCLHTFVIRAWPCYLLEFEYIYIYIYICIIYNLWIHQERCLTSAFPRPYVDEHSIVFSWVRWFVPFHNKIHRCRADWEMVRFVKQSWSTVACILYPEKIIVFNMTYVWFNWYCWYNTHIPYRSSCFRRCHYMLVHNHDHASLLSWPQWLMRIVP